MFDIKDADPRILEYAGPFNLFSSYRIVDIDTYFVYDWKGHETISANKRCFEIWQRDEACKNCISNSCIRENKQIVKLEAIDGKIYLIVAIPITLDGKLFSLELINDVTDSLVINDAFHKQNVDVQGIISQMNDMALRDPYTRLYNKRFAEQEVSKAMIAWKPEHTLFLGVIDIDHFKKINDTYGHIKGDDVLGVMSQILENYGARGNGWASRMGGDEFMVLWNDITPEEASDMAQALKEELSAHMFAKDDDQFTVSVSIGICQYSPQISDWKVFIDSADKKMYLDKKSTHNKPA